MTPYPTRLYFLLAGINDVAQGADAPTIISRLKVNHAARQAAAGASILSTLTKAATITGAPETVRQAVNASLRAEHSWAHYFVDPDADARFSNTANTTYYQGDGVHYTVAGAGVVASLVAAKVLGQRRVLGGGSIRRAA